MSANLLDMYNGFIDQIKQADVLLDSRLDPSVAGKKKVIDNLITDSQANTDQVLQMIVNGLQKASPAELAGILFGVQRGLNETYQKQVDTFVDSLVKDQPKPEPLITEEQEADVLKGRTDLVNRVNQLIEMTEKFDPEIAKSMVKPSKRTGKQGPRGKRALSFYTFSVGDKTYKDLTEVQTDYATFYSKAADITRAMRGDTKGKNKKGEDVWIRGVKSEENPNSIDTTEPPDEFSFTLANGDILKAKRNEDDPNGEDEANAPDENSDEAIYEGTTPAS